MTLWRAVEHTKIVVGPKGNLVRVPHWHIVRFETKLFENGKSVYRCDEKEDALHAQEALNSYTHLQILAKEDPE